MQKFPGRDRVRDLRIARRWSMEALAERIGATVSTIHRIETGQTRLISEHVAPLARAFGIDWTALFIEETEATAGLAEDASPYIPQPGDPASRLSLGPNQDIWTVRTAALDAIGLTPGQRIIVDISAEAVAGIGTGDALVVQHMDRTDPTRAETRLMQFAEPSIFHTNSATLPNFILDGAVDEIAVKGVIAHVLSDMRQNTSR
jgi:transcriptional regulator with XRE-family HTH domain